MSTHISAQVDWQEYNRRMRVGAHLFVSLPMVRTHLVILSLCLQPHAQLMGRLLRLGSKEFARTSFLSTADDKKKFRVLECARCSLTDDFSMHAVAYYWRCWPVCSGEVDI